MIGPLTTQLVGSYTKPQWLVRHEAIFNLEDNAWRVEPAFLDAARADAARLAIWEQERLGVDVLTDGEAWRLAYNSYFYARLGGIDAVALGTVQPRQEHAARKILPEREAELKRRRSRLPRVVGPVTWPGPLSVAELRFLKAHAGRPVKATVIGPFSAQGALIDEHYGDERAVAMALADALNKELRALEEQGPALLQVDEPQFHSRLEKARSFGLEALERVTWGLRTPVIAHVCYGYSYFTAGKDASPTYSETLALLASCRGIAGISLEYEQPGHQPELLRHCGDKHVLPGLINLGTGSVETPEHVAGRIRAALQVVPPERLHPAPDCGMWHLPREVAAAKLSALVEGTRLVKVELGLLPRTASPLRAAG